MSETTPPAGTRGAVDLSSVAGLTAPTAATAGAGLPAGAVPGDAGQQQPAVPEGLVVEVDAGNLQEALNRTLQVPGVLVLWGSAYPQTRELFDTVVRVAASLEGRVLVLSADLSTSPDLLQAFQPLLVQAFGQPSVPATFGLLQGQPVPLFPGVVPESEVRAVLDQLLQAAVQNGITGRVQLEAVEGADDADTMPPLHEEAFEAIERGDLDGAVAAYQQALAEDPNDQDAELGLSPGAAHAAHPGGRPRPPRGPPLPPTRPTSRPPSSWPTSTCSVVTSRTRSAGCSTSCAAPRAPSATAPAPTSSSCSRSSARRTSACARAARP